MERLPTAAGVALACALVGALLSFRLWPDPWQYVGAVLLLLAPVAGIVAVARVPSRITVAVLLIATAPLVLEALTLFLFWRTGGDN